jgi:hypothetical protein
MEQPSEGRCLSLDKISKPGFFFHKIKVGKEDPQEYIVRLLGLGRYSIWMSTNLHLGFYRREKVVEAMRDAAKRVKDFRLLLDASSLGWERMEEELPWLAGLAREGYIAIKKSQFQIPHWLIVDRKHIRLEKMHPPEEVGSENIILLNCDEAVADLLSREWLRTWESAVWIAPRQ